MHAGMQLSEQMVSVDDVVQNACAMLSVVLSLETGSLLLSPLASANDGSISITFFFVCIVTRDSIYTFPRHG
jgi:hypothetical protein